MKDLTGKKFNSWLVLKEVDRDIRNKRVWECSCECGDIYNITQGNLTSNKSKMCRNCSLERRKELPKKEDHRLYSTWKSMKSRCNNPNVWCYYLYGGRGIKICDRWNNFDLFIEDMGDSFIEGLTLDRIDSNGNYCPENCRWATKEEQSNNKQDSLNLLFEGGYYTEAQLARKTGINRTTIQQRRRNGWTVEEMVYGKSSVEKYRNVEYNGIVYKSLKDIADAFNINRDTFRYRIRNGWALDEAINGKI